MKISIPNNEKLTIHTTPDGIQVSFEDTFSRIENDLPMMGVSSAKIPDGKIIPKKDPTSNLCEVVSEYTRLCTELMLFERNNPIIDTFLDGNNRNDFLKGIRYGLSTASLK